MLDMELPSPACRARFCSGLRTADIHFSNDSFTSNDMSQENSHANEIAAEECSKFQEVLETRCLAGGGGSGGSSSNDSSPYHKQKKIPRKDSQSSIEREILALNQEMEQIQLECQEIVEQHSREQIKVRSLSEAVKAEPFRSPRMVPRMGTRLDYLKQLHAVQEGQGEPPLWLRQEHLARTNPAVSAHSGMDIPSSSGVSTMDSPSKRTPPCKGVHGKGETPTTSAYNTGDSCRSTPLTLELHQASDDSGRSHKNSTLSLVAPSPLANGNSKSSDCEKGAGAAQSSSSTSSTTQQQSKDWSSDGDGKLAKSNSSTSVSRMSQTQDEENMPQSLQELYSQYADVMYTNHANLEHTIQVQQKLFEQQLMQRARQQALAGAAAAAHANGHPSGSKTLPTKSCGAKLLHQNGAGASPSHKSQASSDVPPELPPPDTGNTSAGSKSVEMEWVVKRRADGSRYITRRPVRSKLLKERAKKILEERCGMTTDDDAVSELKVGRYWNKEDRKRHLEKARDHRKKKESLLKQKMETVKEQDEGKKEPNIVELSHRKMMKNKGKKVLDDFTTVQEMMAHGSREAQGKTYNPLLSVTTVWYKP